MAQRINAYTVVYREFDFAPECSIVVTAPNADAAYDISVYEVLPAVPYAAYVQSVTYQNGKTRRLHTERERWF